MESADPLIESVRRVIGLPLKLPYRASAIAMDLFRLRTLHGLAEDPRVVDLGARFMDRLREAGLDDLLGHQLRYAVRLAGAAGDLGYEEMHKLFSLCDEVHALRELGFRAEPALVREFEVALRARFAGQSRAARLAAQDKAEDWNKPLWWYAENLSNQAP